MAFKKKHRFLGKPVLVLRDVTERPEAVAAGAVQLVGARIALESFKASDAVLETMNQQLRVSPYGDGFASSESWMPFAVYPSTSSRRFLLLVSGKTATGSYPDVFA